MKIHNIEQGTDEWFAVRRGKLTASNATAIGSAGKGLETYVKKIALELVGIYDEPISTKDMERGNELEPIAVMKYEMEKDCTVERVGFVEYTPDSGCSPDGFVGEDGLIEIKARNNAKHLALLLGGTLDSGVIWQMQMQMLCTDRKWCDFVSYNDNFSSIDKSIFIRRVERDETKIAQLIVGISKGAKMVKELHELIKQI